MFHIVILSLFLSLSLILFDDVCVSFFSPIYWLFQVQDRVDTFVFSLGHSLLTILLWICQDMVIRLLSWHW